MGKGTPVTYYRMGELSNGAVISQPYCNIEHKYHIAATIKGEDVGIHIMCHQDGPFWTFRILSVYKNGRNYFATKYLYKYKDFVGSCITEMFRKNYLPKREEA